MGEGGRGARAGSAEGRGRRRQPEDEEDTKQDGEGKTSEESPMQRQSVVRGRALRHPAHALHRHVLRLEVRVHRRRQELRRLSCSDDEVICVCDTISTSSTGTIPGSGNGSTTGSTSTGGASRGAATRKDTTQSQQQQPQQQWRQEHR